MFHNEKETTYSNYSILNFVINFDIPDYTHSTRINLSFRRNIRQDQVLAVQKLYIDAVERGLPHLFGDNEKDPFLAKDATDFKKRKEKFHNNVRHAKRKIIEVSHHVRDNFNRSCENEQRRILSMLEFDCKNAMVHWFECEICKSKFLFNEKKIANRRRCDTCSTSAAKHRSQEEYLLKNNFLPVWKLDGKIQYHVPSELQGLSLGEKLLIQRYSTLLPLVHIYKGRLGTRGNSVSFDKDMNVVCNDLPRKRADLIVVIKNYYDSKREEYKSQHFKIRRLKVINALKWLQKHHTGYHNINIKEEHLDWVGSSNEAYLGTDNVTHLEVQNLDNDKVGEDVETVALKQTELSCMDGLISHNGVCNNIPTTWNDPDDSDLLKDIQKVADEHSDKAFDTIEYPHISKEPIDEFNEPNLFANSYPWLFPGGLGDKSQALSGTKNNDNQIRQWVQGLMRWHDGRFMRDEIFSFHLNNYQQRHMNNSSGLVFVKQFIEDSSISIKEIQDQIMSGDNSFISKLQYFAGQKIRGSDPYWRSMKTQVDEWIAYHLKENHGPPTLFLTFSCAEYWWKELEDLLYQRCQGTEDEVLAKDMKQSHDEKKKMKAKSILVERYSAVIQEFFQIRMENWLTTVGKEEFGLEYYWMRFEFAKGRGTIHAHILGITKDSHVVKEFYDAMNTSQHEYVNVVSKYARDTLTMTEEKPHHQCLNKPKEERVNPLSHPYCTIISDQEDKAELVDNVHMHECGKFCLRYPRGV